MKKIITISNELYENFIELSKTGTAFSHTLKGNAMEEMSKALVKGTRIMEDTDDVKDIMSRLKGKLDDVMVEYGNSVEHFLERQPFTVLEVLLDIIDDLSEWENIADNLNDECAGLLKENIDLNKRIKEEKEKTEFVFNEAKKKLDRPDLQWGGKPYACKINGKPVDIGEQNRFAHFVVASYFASCYLQNEPYNLTPEDALEYAYTMGSYFDDIAFGSDGREKAIKFAFDIKNEDRIRELRNTLMNTYDELFRISGKQTIADELDFVKTELEKREKGV